MKKHRFSYRWRIILWESFTVVSLCIMALLWAYIFSIIPVKPIVFWSYSENRCVSVIKVIDDKEVKCKCDDLDYKYERVWVK